MTTLALLLILAQQATATISGRVTDALTHQPIRGVLVATTAGSRDLTDDDGRYTLKHPADIDVQIRFAVAGYSPLEKTSRFADDAFLDLDAELPPLARIAGRVTDKETGDPIDHVLSVRRSDKSGGKDVLPDQDGKFEVADLEPGDYTVRLRQDNDAMWEPAAKKHRHSYGAAVYPDTIHLEQGERRFMEIRLPALEAHSVAGIVEAPSGHEKEPLTFTLWHLGIPLPTVSQAHASGPFRIDGLTRGDYGLTVETAKDPNLAFARQSFTVTDHDVASLKLTLQPAANITGTVRMAEDNTPLPPKLELWLNSASEWGPCGGYCMVMPSPSLLLPGDGFLRIFQKPVLVVDGKFQAEGIPPDDYWPELLTAAKALPDGYAILSGDDHPISLYGGAQVDFVLTSRPGTIAGVVRDASTGVTLTPASDTRRQATTRSGQNGEFVFRNLAPGKYRVNGQPVEVGFGQTVSLVIQTP
jgi:hypothetical protein